MDECSHTTMILIFDQLEVKLLFMQSSIPHNASAEAS